MALPLMLAGVGVWKVVAGVAGVLVASAVVEGVKDRTRPAVWPLKRGCVVYRDHIPPFAEHSGIYIGGGEVVSRDGDGDVVSEGLDEFRAVEGQTIYVSCFDGEAVGDEEVADRAEDMVGSSRSYNLILNNCHQFASGCLTGDFENADTFLWMLKDTASKELGADAWGIFGEY